MRILRFSVAGVVSIEVASNAKKRTHAGLSPFAQRGFYHHNACDFFPVKQNTKKPKDRVDQEGTLAAGRLCGRLVESKLEAESTTDPRDLKSLPDVRA